ncbi:MAG: FAD-dependent oxidoreductase, partial [Caulobacterales bacterium]|nr:FAD-dependent oxidoreductase [Caulobacterales bacterium]
EAAAGLAEAAARAVPALAGAPITERWAGVRPAAPDHAPLLGRAAPGVFVAAGHHRNGVLLTPVTALAMAALIADGVVDSRIAPFDPARFESGPPHGRDADNAALTMT